MARRTPSFLFRPAKAMGDAADFETPHVAIANPRQLPREPASYFINGKTVVTLDSRSASPIQTRTPK